MAGPVLDAGVAYPGDTSIPATCTFVVDFVNGFALDATDFDGAVPPATDAIASGVADALGGAG